MDEDHVTETSLFWFLDWNMDFPLLEDGVLGDYVSVQVFIKWHIDFVAE